MLNDALNSSFSPAGQKSFNQRLKSLEQKIDGYDESITTGTIESDSGTIKNLKSENIETDKLKVNVNADIESLKFGKAEGAEATITKLKSTDVETENFKATNIEATDATISNITSENATVNNVDAETVKTKNLSVENIIEELNLKKLNIRGKEALGALAEAVLDIGNEYNDVTINSANRPKWMEANIVTEEQLTTPFTLRGVIENAKDLPAVRGNVGKILSLSGSGIGSKEYTQNFTDEDKNNLIFEWANSEGDDFFQDWYWKAHKDDLKAQMDGAITSSSTLVASGITEKTSSYLYDMSYDDVTSHETSRIENANIINYGYHYEDGKPVDYNVPTVKIGSDENKANVGDVYLIKNGEQPQVAICVPDPNLKPIEVNANIDPFVTDKVDLSINNRSGVNNFRGERYALPGGARKKDIIDGCLCHMGIAHFQFFEIRDSDTPRLHLWDTLRNYVATSGYSPCVAISKYAQEHIDEFKTEVKKQYTGTFETKKTEGFYLPDDKTYLVPKSEFHPTTVGQTFKDFIDNDYGYYVLTTSFNPNEETFLFSLAGSWKASNNPTSIDSAFDKANWNIPEDIGVGKPGYELKFEPNITYSITTKVAAPGADGSLTKQAFIDSVIGKTFLAKAKVDTGETWYVIPYPVLQMYRTASNQDVIDADLQKQIDDINVVQEGQNSNIDNNTKAINENKAAQDAINKAVTEQFESVDTNITELSEKVDGKISDAPANGKVYGRKDNAWVDFNADGAYVPKKYNKVEKYFSNITLKKDPAYVNTSQTVELIVDEQPVTYYIGLWHLQPAETGDYAYTTKNAYDFVKEHKDILNETVYQGVVETFEAGRVIGTLDNDKYQDIGWTDILVEFDTEKAGDDIYRPDGAVLGTNNITSNDDGININSDIGFTANTPSPASDVKSVINRQYIDDNLSLSTSSASSGVAGATLEFKKKSIDFVTDRAWSYQPMCQSDTHGLSSISQEWYRRCKDYVYYKLDNAANQPASSFSFWLSVDKDGNVINMTNPREDKGNAVASQSGFERWLTFSPELWEEYPETANVAYWPHSNPTYAGYITMFDNGRFKKYVEDSAGVSNSIYLCPVVNADFRTVGGKSLKGSPRMLIVNNSSDVAYNTSAGIIGVDSNNVSGLDKFKKITLSSVIKHGYKGVAAGKKHWFAQQGVSNTFMVISDNGTVASYVLSDPVTQTALGTTVQNAQENYIELANGDAIFCVKDYSTDIMYHIYCHDNFEEEGVDPFEVYRSAIDFSSAAADGWPCCKGFPYVEFGEYVYFFPTVGGEVGSTNSFLANATLTAQYSRFNKSTKTWSDATLPWINADVHCGTVPVKTHDPIENKDYLWLFQSMDVVSASAPTQSQVVVISENGALQYVDLGTGSSIHWFDVTPKSGEKQLATDNRPLNISGDVSWPYVQTVRGNVPFVAVTQEGIGLMLSNSARDVCVFYGNCHFAIYSYSNATDGGPWTYFVTEARRGPSFIGGKYGALLFTVFDNSIDLVESDDAYGCIYIKPTGEDYLGEPEYFWTPVDQSFVRMFREKYDGADWAKSDFSDYRKAGLTTVTPAAGGWDPSIGFANIRVEDIPSSNTLYLKDGDNIISSVNV